MPSKTTIAKEKFITTTTEDIEETTLDPVKVIRENNNIASITTEEIEETTFVPVDSTTAKKTIETITTVELGGTTFVPVTATNANKDIETSTTEETEDTTLGLIEATIRNENIMIPENEIFLPFFDEEGSGSEKNMEEIVEEENKRREPRIMDDPVLKFLTYRTETSVSKVERV